MYENLYVFEYKTKKNDFKRISYGAFSYRSALKRFNKNVRCVELFNVRIYGKLLLWNY